MLELLATEQHPDVRLQNLLAAFMTVGSSLAALAAMELDTTEASVLAVIDGHIEDMRSGFAGRHDDL
jgi:hypothetical protein